MPTGFDRNTCSIFVEHLRSSTILERSFRDVPSVILLGIQRSNVSRIQPGAFLGLSSQIDLFHLPKCASPPELRGTLLTKVREDASQAGGAKGTSITCEDTPTTTATANNSSASDPQDFDIDEETVPYEDYVMPTKGSLSGHTTENVIFLGGDLTINDNDDKTHHFAITIAVVLPVLFVSGAAVLFKQVWARFNNIPIARATGTCSQAIATDDLMPEDNVIQPCTLAYAENSNSVTNEPYAVTYEDPGTQLQLYSVTHDEDPGPRVQPHVVTNDEDPGPQLQPYAVTYEDPGTQLQLYSLTHDEDPGPRLQQHSVTQDPALDAQPSGGRYDDDPGPQLQPYAETNNEDPGPQLLPYTETNNEDPGPQLQPHSMTHDEDPGPQLQPYSVTHDEDPGPQLLPYAVTYNEDPGPQLLPYAVTNDEDPGPQLQPYAVTNDEDPEPQLQPYPVTHYEDPEPQLQPYPVTHYEDPGPQLQPYAVTYIAR
ncbi:hypothetical protein Bbelb_056670 [Branchiostoma belcheri]|nr:hypothetical protein Bbelb_056670 [Branchiostoma belcheri]